MWNVFDIVDASSLESAATLSRSLTPGGCALREEFTSCGLANRDGGGMFEPPLHRDGEIASGCARHPTDALHVVEPCEIRLEHEGSGKYADPSSAEVPAEFRVVELTDDVGSDLERVEPLIQRATHACARCWQQDRRALSRLPETRPVGTRQPRYTEESEFALAEEMIVGPHLHARTYRGIGQYHVETLDGQ